MDKKWNLQDIKPSEKRRTTLRPSPRQAERRSEESPTVSEAGEAKRRPAARKERRGSKKGIALAALAVVLLAFGGVLFSALTSKTVVTVFPRWREPTVNAVFEAKRDASGTELAYEIMSLEAQGDREVTATGQEEVEEQATGRVTIYNTSNASQRLITNTRFESAGGLIFRIKDSAVVPPAAGGTPGSISVEVFADQAGPEYNLPANTRFTAPGLKGSDLYESIYAENPAAISGGHRGPKFIIDNAELESATASLRSELQQALAGRVASEKPAGFATFDAAIRYAFEALPAEDLGNGKVKIREKVTLQLPMFKNEDFASFIAAATVPGYEGEPVRIENLSVFTFEYAGEPDLSAGEPITFKLLGRPKVIWAYDAEQLKRDLAGGAQTALNTVLGGYPAIEKANATIKPFWRRSFPEDPAGITVVESLTTE